MLGYTSYSRDWSPGGGGQQLSVVTTVWGVSTATQSGPHPSASPFPHHDKDPKHFSTTYRLGTPSYGDGPGGMNGVGAGGTGGDGQYGGALSAAAMVAAATATATATASVVAMHERQDLNAQFNQMHGMGGQGYGGGYGGPGQRGPMSDGMGNMGPMTHSHMGPYNNMPMHCNMINPKMTMQGGGAYPRRVAPYPSPAMSMSPMHNMSNKQQRASYGPAPSPHHVHNYPPGNPVNQPQLQMNQGYSNRCNVPSQYQPPQQQTPLSPAMGSYPSGPSVRGASGSPSLEGAMRSNSGGANGGGMSYQLSPLAGNPTPPLTPAGMMPPYGSPPADVKPGPFLDVKPNVAPVQKEEELRLTFPVRDGIILPPFRLEHNLAVSNHVFQLKPTVHQTLMWRPRACPNFITGRSWLDGHDGYGFFKTDLELQLKCFHHEDRQMNTNWPASVQVSVNAIPLSIDRGEHKTSHKPLYLKDVCQPGRNTIQITVSACCCSHLFVLQLVHRPSVRSVLQGLLRKRLLTADHCIAKLKRNFGGHAGSDAVEQTALKVSIKCPITFKRITLPARGHDCKHIQCFDLESYLQLNCERGSWRCPVCNKPAQLEGLEVDQYMWAILNGLTSSDVDEVTIDSSANWRPARSHVPGVKQEPGEDGDGGCSGVGGKKPPKGAMSPGSMTLPTLNSWDNINSTMSPYMPPDMNSIASGSMMTGNTNGAGGMQRAGSYDMLHSPLNKYHNINSSVGTPLAHLAESVNCLDPLSAMEKAVIDQQPHTPHTPHTPPGPPSVPPDIPSDLNFDPAAVIDGETTGQEALNLLPENVVDPMELLSYLDPPDLSTPPSSGGSAGAAGPTTNDDILALFE